jgi:predicted metal-dependent phosphoesterase TrpH
MSDLSRLFKIDFHVHTHFSYDSPMPPRLVLEVARRKGLAGVAITDHDSVEGALQAVAANRYKDFHVIPGIEVKSDLGDIIGLYVSHKIKSYRFQEVIQEIHDNRGLVYVPHPMRTFGPDRLKQIHAEHPTIDLWEMYNGRYAAEDFRTSRSLFAELGILSRSLCGSDAHFPWDIGVLRTVFTALPQDSRTLLALCSSAELEAEPMTEIAVSTSVTLGAMTKAFKRREYFKLGRAVATLPFRVLKRLLN